MIGDDWGRFGDQGERMNGTSRFAESNAPLFVGFASLAGLVMRSSLTSHSSPIHLASISHPSPGSSSRIAFLALRCSMPL